jgi:hypothetical protein
VEGITERIIRGLLQSLAAISSGLHDSGKKVGEWLKEEGAACISGVF